MILDRYQAAQVLAEATAPPRDGGLAWMAAPWMTGLWLGATDARVVILLRPPDDFTTAPALPDSHAAIVQRHTNPIFYDTIGRATLRALAGWAKEGPGWEDPGGRAAVGPAVFDRCELCRPLALLAMAGDCDVRVGVSRGLVSERAGVRSLLLDGVGWRLMLMGDPDGGPPPPGDDTRPPLEPLP